MPEFGDRSGGTLHGPLRTSSTCWTRTFSTNSARSVRTPFYKVEVLNLAVGVGYSQRCTRSTARAVRRYSPHRNHQVRTCRALRRRRGAPHDGRTAGESGDVAATRAFSSQCRRIGLSAAVDDMRWNADTLILTVDAALTLALAGEPLVCKINSGGLLVTGKAGSGQRTAGSPTGRRPRQPGRGNHAGVTRRLRDVQARPRTSGDRR